LKKADEGHDIVVVGHSWSGIIVRAKEGKKSGVIHLAFVCTFVPPEHTSLVQAFGGQEPEWYDVKVCEYSSAPHGHKRYVFGCVDRIKDPWVMPTGSEDIFYNNLPPSDAAYWVSQLRPHS
jgi:hypothetical protein